MTPITNVLTDARNLLERRLIELDEERERLERALSELDGRVTRLPRVRVHSSSRNSASNARRHRKRRGSTRSDQALKLIEQRPGITTFGLAESMKIKPNYLYRVLGDLAKEGRVKKDGRQYYPVGS